MRSLQVWHRWQKKAGGGPIFYARDLVEGCCRCNCLDRNRTLFALPIDEVGQAVHQIKAVIASFKRLSWQVIQDNEIVIVDFWADWCGPCQGFAPVFESMSEKFANVVFAKVDTEAEQELASHFQIRSIPFLMVFRHNT